MSTQKIKFYKFSNSTSSADRIATAKATEGAVIYLVDVRELWIGGATAAQAQLVIKGANDVTFSNNVLTISHYDNAGTATTQTLDFSDVASASSTMAVFTALYEKMGLTGTNHDTIDYTGTNYLSTLGGQDQPAKNLVNADKALDTAIYDNTHKGAATGATYDTQHLSQTWTTVVTNNTIAANDTLDADIDKLDKKIAGLADEVIANEQVTQEAFSAVANSVGLESDMSLDLSDANLTVIKDDTSVKEALEDLDAAFATAGKVDDVKINNTTIVSNKIADIAVDGTYNASTNKIASESTVKSAIDAISGAGLEVDNTGAVTVTTQAITDDSTKIATTAFVHDMVEDLDGSATIASKTGDVVTIKTGVTETDGKISNDSGTDIVLEEVAVTGAAADVSIADSGNHTTETTVEGALQEIYGRVETLEGSFDVIVSTDAASTPYGVKWGSPEVTGTLVASADTFHKIYLVPASGGSNPNSYDEYITTRTSDGQNPPTYTYGWERLGTIDVDLTGYVKTITLNGKQYAVTTNTVDIELTDVITGVTGETAISGGDTNYVKVAANTVKDTTNGTNITTLSTTTKIEEVADGFTKDGTATYSEGHYVIENGKLVSAAGKSTGDTYTKSANDGLTTASDVKAYVDSKVDGVVDGLDVAEYAQASVSAANGETTITVKGIKEENGEIGASTSSADTTILADGEYNASTNKLATQSTVSTAISNLDADVTSNDAAVANVEVKQVDAVINDVIVTTNAAGVSYTASTTSTQPGLSATTSTGAVTGGDITAIKNYVDDKVQNACWEEYE